jgi:hypothetical protein
VKYGYGKSITLKNDRSHVREVCRDGNVDPLAAYTVAMAWGGQTKSFFEQSLSNGSRKHLANLLNALRTSKQGRDADFEMARIASNSISGLGISFYTKLLYFFRPCPDAYILDKWTAMASHLLFVPAPIRLEKPDTKGHCSPKRGKGETTASEYELYCHEVDNLPAFLWPGLTVAGDVAEMAMFGVPPVAGDKSKLWRKYVECKFPPPIVGKNTPMEKITLKTLRVSFLNQLLTAHQEALKNGRNLPTGMSLIPKPALRSSADPQKATWDYDPANKHVRIFKHLKSPETLEAFDKNGCYRARVQLLANENGWIFVPITGQKPGLGFKIGGVTTSSAQSRQDLVTDCVKAMEVLYSEIP